MDFCFAVRRQGFRLAVIGESVLYHHTSQTPGRFEHDLQNGKLFYQRWHQDVTADMHRLARMDGYELRIGPMLSCRLSLPEVRERELDVAFAGAAFDAAACVAQLEREPLWRGGWLRLMDQLEAQGRGPDALRAGVRALSFFSSPDVQSRLLRLLRKEGLQEQMVEFMHGLEEDRDAKGDSALRHAFVQAARRKAYADGDTALADLLNAWLLGYGKIRN